MFCGGEAKPKDQGSSHLVTDERLSGGKFYFQYWEKDRRLCISEFF